MSNWQLIETAPKGGGAERRDDPAWVDPPKLLLFLKDGTYVVCYHDLYYDTGGNGYKAGQSPWVCDSSGENVLSEPTHWMQLPSPPNA